MKRLFALALLAAVAATPLAADARDYGGREGRPFQMAQSGRQVPLSRVLAQLAAHYPGRHLNTTMGDADGRPAYFVQWQMENGRVVVFVVDAETGQVIGRQGG